MPIPPKKTLYKDKEYRSQLEARRAVYFDELGAIYTYEPVVIMDYYIQYRPDFRLDNVVIDRERFFATGQCESIYVEQKYNTNYESIYRRDRTKIEMFARKNNIIVMGNITIHDERSFHTMTSDEIVESDKNGYLDSWKFVDGGDGKCFFVPYEYSGKRILMLEPYEDLTSDKIERINRAIEIASMAHFQSVDNSMQQMTPDF